MKKLYSAIFALTGILVGLGASLAQSNIDTDKSLHQGQLIQAYRTLVEEAKAKTRETEEFDQRVIDLQHRTKQLGTFFEEQKKEILFALQDSESMIDQIENEFARKADRAKAAFPIDVAAKNRRLHSVIALEYIDIHERIDRYHPQEAPLYKRKKK